jgi:hypothetical protein
MVNRLQNTSHIEKNKRCAHDSKMLHATFFKYFSHVPVTMGSLHRFICNSDESNICLKNFSCTSNFINLGTFMYFVQLLMKL